MPPSLLYVEITTGPLSAELAQFVAVADEESIHAILHRRDISVYGPVDVGQFVSWSAANGMLAKIEDHAANQASPLRSIAIALQKWIGGNTKLNFDLSKEAHQLMLQSWVTEGELTVPHRDSLYVISEKLVSRADQVDFPITENDISNALNQGY